MERSVAPLAEAGVDLVVAADCCYIDQVGEAGQGTTDWDLELDVWDTAVLPAPACMLPALPAMPAASCHLAPTAGTPRLQDGTSPSTPAFVETCAGLCGAKTRCLVAFERRAPEARGAGWARCSAARGQQACSTQHWPPAAKSRPSLPLPPALQVRACLIQEAKKRFRHVKQVPLSAVPYPLRLEYVDIWELQQPLAAKTDCTSATRACLHVCLLSTC